MLFRSMYFLIRFEQKANEARNYDINISEKKFLWVLLNNMKHHRFYKERIASLLTTFELNPSFLSQRWIENKFYSMDEERMHMFRNRFIKENARVSFSDKKTIPSTHSNFKSSSQRKGPKSLRCKYCYNIGHTDNSCRKKVIKQAPYMPEWVNKAICRKCKKKGQIGRASV